MQLDRLKGFGFLFGRDQGNSGFDDAGFFGSDFSQRLAEPFFMIEIDVGDDAGDGRDDVGGVEASAQPGFPDNQVAVLFGEIRQGHYRDDFEESGVLILGEGLEPFLKLCDPLADIIVADPAAIDLDPFGERDQVRGGEEPDAQSG